MSVDAVTTFLALLALAAAAVTAVSLVAWLVTLGGRPGPSWASAWRSAVSEVALPGAWAVATTCTLGSLYLSEVAHFPPCELCWYQRIAMYPLAVILGVAALRRDTSVRWYVVPVAGIGLAISVYHYLLERFPDSVASACTTDVPCTTVWVWKFHFLSIPGMAGIGFAAIIALVLQALPRGTGSGPRDDQSTRSAPSDPAPSEAATT